MYTTFQGSRAWTILSPIEQQILQKIETVGTPLKEWNVSINRGVLTGYNEAFLITSEKRNEILNKCLTAEEHTRTAAIIRPILRGRDIKRYGYEWAGLYLIATFPSKNYNIEDYPAIRDYLLSFGKERLEQTGATYIVDGKPIKSRKATNNQWFETQDSISYSEDFLKPKIVYIEIMSGAAGSAFPCFAYDENQMVVMNTAYSLCSDSVDVRYLLGVLNSSIGKFIIKNTVTQLGLAGYRILWQYVSLFPIVKKPAQEAMIIACVEDILEAKKKGKETRIKETQVNQLVADIYGLNEQERQYIATQV